MGALKEPTRSLYEADFAAWAFEQAAAVQRKDWAAIDVPNLVEELESLGKQQRAELRNRLIVLLMHLAKWQHQPAQRAVHGGSWKGSIVEQRGQIEDHLDDNPSLRPYVPEAMQRAWKRARISAANETGLDVAAFAQACPYSFEQAMSEGWLPD